MTPLGLCLLKGCKFPPRTCQGILASPWTEGFRCWGSFLLPIVTKSESIPPSKRCQQLRTLSMHFIVCPLNTTKSGGRLTWKTVFLQSKASLGYLLKVSLTIFTVPGYSFNLIQYEPAFIQALVWCQFYFEAQFQ